MANKRIDELTAATSIASTDLIFVGNPSTGELKKATANLARRLMFSGSTDNAVSVISDGTTFYFGQSGSAPTASDSSIIFRFYSPIAGTINSVYVYQDASTSQGTNESWSLYLRVNATTDTLIESLSSTASPRVWSNTSMGVSISAGDYFVIKSVNPTWATNPSTAIYLKCVIFLEY